jgi:hypothetical protein
MLCITPAKRWTIQLVKAYIIRDLGWRAPQVCMYLAILHSYAVPMLEIFIASSLLHVSASVQSFPIPLDLPSASSTPAEATGSS